MATYIALLRGIMPSNPNMKNNKLKALFESLGLTNVSTVISSGNVVFDTRSKNISALETKIEKAFISELGLKSTTIIRSQEDIAKLVKKNPFKGAIHQKPNYLIVTFFKSNKPELCTSVDMKTEKGTEFMKNLETKYGKEITTRSWNTILKILKKMEALA